MPAGYDPVGNFGEQGRTQMAKTPRVGEPAPDFELEGTEGPFRLSEHRGERVVLLFYPGDNTPVCTKQFCSYRDRSEDMANCLVHTGVLSPG
jgi:peroxiredoxin